MKVIHPSFTSKSEIAYPVVSLFLGLLAVLVYLCPHALGQDPPPAFQVPESVRKRIEGASNEAWEGFVSLTSRAILGSDPSVDAELSAPRNLPREMRVSWVSERVTEWTRSSSFIERQRKTWLHDRCGLTEPDRHLAWNFHRHDDWLRKSIANNDSFLQFMQLQIAGESLSSGTEDHVATASWFRTIEPDPYWQETHRHATQTFFPPSVPTPDRLPINLKWSELQQVPGIVHDCSQENAERLRDIETAMESVLQSEQNDWRRILMDDGPKRWHQQQDAFPIPDPNELTFDLSASGQGQNPIVPGHLWQTPWSYTEPWSVILELKINDAELDSGVSPITLVRQRIAGGKAGNGKEFDCTIVWDQGSIEVRLAHSIPQSHLTLRTQPSLDKPGTYVVAIVYDGLPSTHALRVWCQGTWLTSQSLHDLLMQDFAPTVPLQLEILGGGESSVCRVDQVECYRIALTELELKGWTQDGVWKEWEACSLAEQMTTREHWARRVDLQWRYQRESLLFYASSFANAMARASFMPTLDPKNDRQMPISLANAVGVDTVRMWNASDRAWLAMECSEGKAATIALAETERQWQRMREFVSAPAAAEPRSTAVEHELTELADGFRSRWDRRQLILALVLSDAWTRIAIASPP